jgi:Skp family chaperone for outer membrane proteins
MTTNSTNRTLTAPVGLAVLFCAVIGAAFVIGSGTANATAARAASPSAVAVVDLGELLEGLDERGYLENELNKEIDQRQQELNDIVKEIERMQEDIKTLPEGDSRTIQKIRDFRIKEVQARALSQFVQEQLSLEKGKMLATIYNKIQTAVCDVTNRDGWDLVLIDDSGPNLPELANEQQMNQLILARRILCASSRVDITSDVKTLMNNQFNAARP